MKVLFILDHKLMNYRIPFFVQLAERGYDITIIHPGPHVNDIGCVNQIISSSKHFLKGIEFRLYKMPESDIVVYMQNIRIANLWTASLNPFRKYKLIHWGIGVSSSKGLSLNKTFISRARGFLSRFASALVLYTDYPLSLFPVSVQKKTFIANNTIYNPEMSDFSLEDKNSFLFIGALNKRKGLEDLLQAFSEFMRLNKTNNVKLDIIGEGEEKSKLIALTSQLKIQEKVNFLGQISSHKEKEIYFKRAIASISPKQAGLSVLESFSYGVPFIAYKDAISGGEHLNIKNGYNGYLLNSTEELTNTMTDMYINEKLARELGTNAFQYYKEKRQMKHMVDSFESAFKYVMNK